MHNMNWPIFEGIGDRSQDGEKKLFILCFDFKGGVGGG